ncbi:hypothetical protein, partial [Aetokthonos hydrillicola]
MSNLPAQYQALPGYNTVYSDSELRQAIALIDLLKITTISTTTGGSSGIIDTGSGSTTSATTRT